MNDDTGNGSHDNVHYRKGVVLGLTLAEVTIILLFCLMMTMLFALNSRDQKIASLSHKQPGESEYKVSQQNVRLMEKRYGRVHSQKELDENFQKLVGAADEDDQLGSAIDSVDIGTPQPAAPPPAKAKSPSGLADPIAPPAKAGENANTGKHLPAATTGVGAIKSTQAPAPSPLPSTTQAVPNSGSSRQPKRKDKVAAMGHITDVARSVVGSSGQPTNTADDVVKGLNTIGTGAEKYKDAGIAVRQPGVSDPDHASSIVAGGLCAHEYTDPKAQADCQKKIVAILGGKGVENPSCWWDKSTRPWKTKSIYDIELSDGGFTIHDLDPAVPEYVAQKAGELPVKSIPVGREMGESEFLAATWPLRQWSNEKKCVFFAGVVDRTGASEKTLFKKRMKAFEARFYIQESK